MTAGEASDIHSTGHVCCERIFERVCSDVSSATLMCWASSDDLGAEHGDELKIEEVGKEKGREERKTVEKCKRDV